MIHVYRWIDENELKALKNNKVISSHQFSTQSYAEGQEGVFVFPRLPSKKFKNAFFWPWGIICVTMKIPLSRINVVGRGFYDGGYFPEMLIKYYSMEDVTSVIYEDQLPDEVFYQLGEGAFGEENWPMMLRC